MEYDVQLEQATGPRPIAVIRRRARPEEFSKVVPEACGIVWGVLRGQKITGAGRHVAVYLDDQVNLEVGVEMDGPFDGHGEVIRSATPAGLIAGVAHFGPYQKLGEAHGAIRDWCARHGYTPAGPNWEIYGHWVDDWNRDASRIRTDVFYLLRNDRQSGALPSDAANSAGGQIVWRPYREPLLTTPARTVTIALVVGAVLAWRLGGLAYWPIATLLVLWVSLGGHWVELWFLNWLRPRLGAARAVQIGARLATWFLGGAVLALGMRLTAMAFAGPRPARWPAWWVGGLGFIGIELVVHLVLQLRGGPSFYNGRG
jgi:hypothetical protein